MTKLAPIRLLCPCCKRVFDSTALRSFNTGGPLTTDLLPMPLGIPPLPYFLHTCPRCGFTGADREFQKRKKFSPAFRAWVTQRLTPLLAQGQLTPAERYKLAGRIAQHRRRPAAEIGMLYLHGAWCCYLQRARENEFYPRRAREKEEAEAGEEEANCRRQAIVWFEKALAKMRSPGQERATLTYLIGELYRRVGETERTARWFNQVPAAAGDDPAAQWLISAAAQQKSNPQEFLEE